MSLAFASPVVVAGRAVGPAHPTYFIADIAANHDGDLGRAKALIQLAAEAGADAAKFQHFKAETIVSDPGFRALGGRQSHQSKWTKPVVEVYAAASLPVDWTPILRDTCREAGIHFFTSPYAFDLVDYVDPYLPAYKIGSGDITWLEICEHIAKKGKPVFLATGASTADEVDRAVRAILGINRELVLMQCNTNYTGSLENMRYVSLNVLKTFAQMYPGAVLGLSDHTPGHATVLGAVALGARAVEKHFTDDCSREGPDHGFAMDPRTWRDMVDRTRELEAALGEGVKRVEANEVETVVVQRRAVRAARALEAGTVLRREDLECLRPCPADAVSPERLADVIGSTLVNHLDRGSHLRWTDLKSASSSQR